MGILVCDGYQSGYRKLKPNQEKNIDVLIKVKDVTAKNRTCSMAQYDVDDLLILGIYKDKPDYAGFTNLDEEIGDLIVCRPNMLRGAHWTIYLTTITNNFIKLELLNNFYRIIYGADPDDILSGQWLTDRLEVQKTSTFWDVFKAFLEVAWFCGPLVPAKYDCQHFVVEFLKKFGILHSKIRKFEIISKALTACAPLVTQYNEEELAKGNFVFEYLEWSQDLDKPSYQKKYS
ncbi:MAG: hypothetical protein KAH18_01340 [Psychromonas sp.]|nr:hypothetical protein [Psychromonas sp.]